MDDFIKLLDDVKKTIDEKPHYIAVQASCHDTLRSGKYQFAVGGDAQNPTGSTGCLVPQSDRIKEIQLKFDYKNINFLLPRDIAGSIFTIVRINEKAEILDLLTYHCIFTPIDSSNPESSSFKESCGFNREPENIPISEGDVINIRTDINHNKLSTAILITFLLELDPL